MVYYHAYVSEVQVEVDHGNGSIISLMIVMGVAFFIPILLQRLKLKAIPVVVAEIIAGIIIGKSGLNLVDVDNNWLTLLSSLGLIFLMFLSGVEIDFKSFSLKKKRSSSTKEMNPFFVSSVIFLFMLILAYIFSNVLVQFGLIDDPFFMTIILSTISLGVVVPVLKENKIIDTQLGQTILLIAVISDFVTMILFAYYLALRDGNTDMIWWIPVMLGLVIVLYYFLDFYRKKSDLKLLEVLRRGTAQIGTRGVFALILFFVAFSETIGVEAILGAFLAGVVVSLLSPDRAFIHQLDSFGYGFLIPIFFVMVGVEFDIKSLLTDSSILLLIPIVLVLIFFTRVTPTLLMKKWFSWRDTFGSGIILTSTLSLAIVAATVSLQMEIISEGMSSAIILVSILTCFIAPIWYSKFTPEIDSKKKRLAIIGANRAALRASIGFQKSDYDVTIYSEKQMKVITDYENQFPIVELDELTLESLLELDLFDNHDLIIVATSNDEENIRFVDYANNIGYEDIIVRIENPKLNNQYMSVGHKVYSDTLAAEFVIQAMVHSPNLFHFLTDQDEEIKEIVLRDDQYDGVPISKLPFLGNTLILAIYRGNQSITPKGDTILRKGDVLILSGTKESMEKIESLF